MGEGYYNNMKIPCFCNQPCILTFDQYQINDLFGKDNEKQYNELREKSMEV